MEKIKIEVIVDNKVVLRQEYPDNNEGEIKIYNYLNYLKSNTNSKFSYYRNNNEISFLYNNSSVKINNIPNSKVINELLNEILIKSIYVDKPQHLYLTTQKGAMQVKRMHYKGSETLFVLANLNEKEQLDDCSKMLIDAIIDYEFNYWKSYFISGKSDATLKVFYDNKSLRTTNIVSNYIMPKVNAMRKEYLDYTNNPFGRMIK